LRGSVLVFTHALLQSVSVTAQLVVQAPWEQTWEDAQALPQAPQLCGSLWVEVQVPLHLIPLFMQRHCPSWQDVPAPQRIPQPPQLELSAWTSTQAPLHIDEPAGQAHCPLAHTMPIGQAFPQPPQLAALV
jgi:hypothetical protein